MSVKRVTINGTQKVWMARISYHGVRRSRVCATKEEARQAERELSAECRKQAAQAEQTGAAPATIKQLCEYYVLDLERRGKGADSIGRAVTTAKAIEAVAPVMLALPISRVTARDVYDFRQARLRGGSKPSTINRDLRTLRAMLKQARPDFRFPGAAFLPEDETRVRWLHPEEELLVLETMASPFREIAKLAALTLSAKARSSGSVASTCTSTKALSCSPVRRPVLGRWCSARRRRRSSVCSLSSTRPNGCSRTRTVHRTAGSTSPASSARPRGRPGSGTSISTTCATMARRWH